VFAYSSLFFIRFRTVVKISLARPDILYCYMSKRSRDKNCALLTVGPINIDIPQHPVVLHGMMTRSTKQLSSTLQVRASGKVVTPSCFGVLMGNSKPGAGISR
jgi:hypothetical protein